MADVLAEGWPMIVLVVYKGWRWGIGDTLKLDELQGLTAEVTTTFDYIPDHYAKGVSTFAWPVKTLIEEIRESKRLASIYSRLRVEPFYKCTTHKGILVTDRNLKPVACLLPVYSVEEAAEKRFHLERRLAVVVPTVDDGFIVFTAWPTAVMELARGGCRRVAEDVFICRDNPVPLLKRLHIAVMESRESVKLDEYLRRVLGLAARRA